jgi:hypothetical protein
MLGKRKIEKVHLLENQLNGNEQDIFFSHLECVSLLTLFPFVLLI